MQTIKWQENDTFFEEENQSPKFGESQPKGMVVEEKEDSKAIQLKKFQDPANDERRKAYLSLIQRFGSLFATGNISEVAQDLLTEDCEVFIFSASRGPCQHANSPQGFMDLYKSMKILERRARETHIDVEKHTVCQISYYRLIYPKDTNPVDVIACEIFSITDERISKFRASYGDPILNEEYPEDPLEPTRKDKMLATVKQINYALAGQPDFEKMATFMNDNTEYKIWRWDDSKCFTLYRNKFAESFNQVQEDMSIKCIIPYEISSDPEAKLISANYVYQLEDNKTSKRYEWLSTCVYYFDQNINIAKIIQQGELFPEGEVDIPFEIHTREKLENANKVLYTGDLKKLDSIFVEHVLFDCSIWAIYASDMPNLGCVKGLKNIEKLLLIKENLKDVTITLVKNVDIYVDVQNESHDVVFTLSCIEGICPDEKSPGNYKTFDSIEFSRMHMENGKIAKIVQFICEVDVPIPTPFDDKSFHCMNIK